MIGYLWEASRGYRLTPWRSPYLLWRIETYSGLHAEDIGFKDFWTFVWTRRRALYRFLNWAERMRDSTRSMHIPGDRQGKERCGLESAR